MKLKNVVKKGCGGCQPVVISGNVTATDEERWSGIGTDSLSSVTTSYLPIPEAPTEDAINGYFAHLASVVVPDFYLGSVVGARQLLNIGVRTRTPAGGLDLLEQDVISPMWSFQDGSATFYVRWIADQQLNGGPTPGVTPLPLNFSDNIYVDTTSWLAKQVAPYVPLNGGQPPGVPVLYMDQMQGIFYPWNLGGKYLYEGYTYRGPGRFALYVWVKQTDPATRVNPSGTPTRIEDIFVRNNPLSRYTSVSGGLDVRLVPFQHGRSTKLERMLSMEQAFDRISKGHRLSTKRGPRKLTEKEILQKLLGKKR